MHKVLNIFKRWLPLAILTGALCCLVYLAVQQDLRQNANDPQIQMVEDAADLLSRGGSIESVIPASKIEISRSLAPFIVAYDSTGQPLASSGLLYGELPILPAGIFEYVRQNGQDRVTWQPEAGVRMAIVVERYQGSMSGFIMAGRSLREVEKRESQVEMEAVGVMIITWAVLLVVVALGELFNPKG